MTLFFRLSFFCGIRCLNPEYYIYYALLVKIILIYLLSIIYYVISVENIYILCHLYPLKKYTMSFAEVRLSRIP
jgi:hypothetical protein